MRAERDFPRFIISEKGAKWVTGGHPWIYEGEVLSGDNCENGAIVDAVSEKGKYLGTGFLSRNSRIRIRLISRNANDTFGEDFWRRRVRYAWDYRKAVMRNDLSCCRMVFGESDGFPGLTVDRFSDILVAQTVSFGMEKMKEKIFPLLIEALQKDGETVRGIYERNDLAIRELEGLVPFKGWYGSPQISDTITEICENGIYYSVDVENGQKTGFFLDQKYNRLAVAGLAKGRKVLDCFTHTGSFALNAARGGAERVTAVDISQAAISLAKKNAERNGLSAVIDFQTADVFDLLPKFCASGKQPFDFIILDPPAFTKSRKTVQNAEKGYKEINFRALKLLPRGGLFATASCSHFMPQERFVKMLRSAASDAGVELKQIEARQQAPDHPILWNVPETDYLKFYIFQVI